VRREALEKRNVIGARPTNWWSKERREPMPRTVLTTIGTQLVASYESHARPHRPRVTSRVRPRAPLQHSAAHARLARTAEEHRRPLGTVHPQMQTPHCGLA